jgi:hypothetical protein
MHKKPTQNTYHEQKQEAKLKSHVSSFPVKRNQTGDIVSGLFAFPASTTGFKLQNTSKLVPFFKGMH